MSGDRNENGVTGGGSRFARDGRGRVVRGERLFICVGVITRTKDARATNIRLVHYIHFVAP